MIAELDNGCRVVAEDSMPPADRVLALATTEGHFVELLEVVFPATGVILLMGKGGSLVHEGNAVFAETANKERYW